MSVPQTYMADHDDKNVDNWVIREFLPNTKSSTPLTDDETVAAHAELCKTAFPRLRKRYVDPPIPNQTYCLISFVTAKGVEPNEKGFYGHVKVRGVFNTIEECNEQMDSIIRYVDSTNHIHVARVGHPVPLVTAGFAAEVSEIDIRETVEKDISTNVKNKANEERKKIEEMQERAEELKKDVEEPNPEDAYIAKRHKLAVLRYTKNEHEKKIAEIRGLLKNCVKELLEESARHPEWEEHFYEKYTAARREANIPVKQDLEGFMGYMVNPIYDPNEDTEE